MEDRAHDLVLYGFSGFVGRQCVEYIATHARPGALRWAIAGRNRNTLEAVKAETGADVADYSVPLFWKRRSAVADDQRFTREADWLGAKCTILKYGDALPV